MKAIVKGNNKIVSGKQAEVLIKIGIAEEIQEVNGESESENEKIVQETENLNQNVDKPKRQYNKKKE